MKSVFGILFVFAVTVCLHTKLGLSLTFDIQPSEINELVPRDVVITCSFDDDDKDLNKLESIMLEHDGKLEAKLYSNGQVAIGSDFQNKIKAVGDIAETVSQSYLEVTVENAGPADAGVYICKGSYTDTSNNTENKEEQGTLIVTEPNEENAVKYLAKRMSELETEMEQQEQDLKQINDKENENVLFVASHNRSQTFKEGLDMVFNTVIVNEGQGYDKATGSFKAPFDGYYLFRLSIFVVPQREIMVYLKSNKGRTLTKLHAGLHVITRDFADTSCVAKLTAGEMVTPYIRDVKNEFIMSDLDFDGRFNTFSGYLLKAL